MSTQSDVRLSQLLRQAQAAADALRGQQRPLPIIGQRQETRKVERRSMLGRVQMVDETVVVPIALPGWPLGIRITTVDNGTSQSVDEIVLAPNGGLTVARVGATSDEPRVISNRPLYAVRVAQYSAASLPDWQPTGDGTGRAARFSTTIQASEAVEILIRAVDAMA